MTVPKDFHRCMICRSKKNLDAYKGNFEVTMCLTTLYFTILSTFEERELLKINDPKILEWLVEKKIIEPNLLTIDIIRNLRDGLANIDMQMGSDYMDNENNITDIEINSSSGSCTFKFDLKQLREFTDFIVKHILDRLTETSRLNCLYDKCVVY